MRLSLSVPSFAKINWSLRIIGKRPDNFHEIRTTLQTISLHDRLEFQTRSDDKVSLICNDPRLPVDGQNLVLRAANALRDRYSPSYGVDIQLEKNIPVQAGLGGGSSNAAVTLLALTHCWGIEISVAELLELASSLGSDVPFFLGGGCALATGTGTDIQTLADPPTIPLIVITPNASVSTHHAYTALQVDDLTLDKAEIMLSSSQNAAFSDDSAPWRRRDFVNDFEPVIFDIYPEVKRAKDSLLGAGATCALLSGSGSSVFGVFDDESRQQQAVKKIKLEAGWRILPCVTVSRNEYARALSDQLIRSHAL
ncbi:MAG TPA: 4-(cytidine 5'-diphospho)-2-C-methyl-D-erythritol kinase [Pyrinomonadaceae bacterium]|nr:4-(cytidine 5'-diphospho)-2-C-methyl-D-erythritol kinase [Pyrinomonadaceae bacterium]